MVGYVALFSSAAICFAFRKAYVPMVIAICLWLASLPVGSLSWTQDINELSVALVQANTSSSEPLETNEVLEVWDQHKNLTLTKTSADLYVWPESAIPTTLSTVQTEVEEIARTHENQSEDRNFLVSQFLVLHRVSDVCD